MALLFSNQHHPSSHGRDHKLRVWELHSHHFADLDNTLPVDRTQKLPDRQPWLLHSVSISALSFSTFALCFTEIEDAVLSRSDIEAPTELDIEPLGALSHFEGATPREDDRSFPPILIATPNGLDQGGIDIFDLPSERRVTRLGSDKDIKTGMVMALSMFHQNYPSQLVVIAGYEDGRVIVHMQDPVSSQTGERLWKKVLIRRDHKQPILSLEVDLPSKSVFTSSADAVIAKVALPASLKHTDNDEVKGKVVNTRHAGQQGLAIRSDSKIFATAGWDGRVRVYSSRSLNELAVLKWHTESCYAVAFASVTSSQTRAGIEANAQVPAFAGAAAVLPPGATSLVHRPAHSGLDKIKQRRNQSAQSTHWLATGGKDGKVSLWDVY